MCTAHSFSHIWAYAVTIHKCQRLSFNCAIVDLSDKVFAEGMAYVALSRARLLAELHIIAIYQQYFRVSVKYLRKINRLRKEFRKNLPFPQ